MKILYLGTAAAEGWPGLFCQCENCKRARILGGKNVRSRSQILINEELLLDFGPDTYYHAIKYGLDFSQVKGILLTHSHTDHFYPQDIILRGLPYAHLKKEGSIVLRGNEKCQELFDKMLKCDNDSENLNERVKFKLSYEFTPFHIGRYQILPLRAIHDEKEKCLIYKITDEEGKSMLYGNDTGYFPEETWEKMKGQHFHLVSLDSTMGMSKGHFKNHMSFNDNERVKKRMIEMGCADEHTVFIMHHFSHNDCGIHEEIERYAEEKGFIAAYDGMKVEI